MILTQINPYVVWSLGVLAYSQEFSTKTLFKSIETLLNGGVFTYKPSKEQQKIESIVWLGIHLNDNLAKHRNSVPNCQYIWQKQV